MRKILGFYEHELNSWIERTLQRVDRVIDVGANDGYFTFGCAAAFQRLGKAGEVIAIEADAHLIDELHLSIDLQKHKDVQFSLIHGFAGSEIKPGFVTLDSIVSPNRQKHNLVKIDVEGAEIDVIMGARSLLDSTNYFLIEIHDKHFLGPLGSLFHKSGLKLTLLTQRPIPILGRETRKEDNCWLISDYE